jgi:hypothetical protein
MNGYTAPGLVHIAHLPHFVYEAWDGDRPLYVGMTNNLERRMREHQRNSAWAKHPHEIRSTEYPNREQAEYGERRRIAELLPPNNARKPRRAA